MPVPRAFTPADAAGARPPKPVALTLGDVCGIGPEILARWFREPLSAGCFVVGDVGAMRRAAALTGGSLVGRELGGGDPGTHRTVLHVHGDHPVAEALQQGHGIRAAGGRPVEVDLQLHRRNQQVGEDLERVVTLADVDAMAENLQGRLVVQVEVDDDHWRTHVYRSAAAAERAVKRARDRGKRSHVTLVQLVPVGVVVLDALGSAA